MSYLIVIPENCDHSKIGVAIAILPRYQEYKEINLVYSYKNDAGRSILQKIYGFASLRSLADWLVTISFLTAIVYINNPDRDYPIKSGSPIIINSNYAFAACGDMLTVSPTSYKGKSNIEVFAQYSLDFAIHSNSDIFVSEPFLWMLKNIARPYVPGCFMSKEGQFSYFNEDLFETHALGFRYTQFFANKNSYTTKNNTTTLTYPNFKKKKKHGHSYVAHDFQHLGEFFI